MPDLQRRLNVALLGVGGLSVVAWIAAAVVTSGRGLDLTDEGYYLLSYRWWDSTPRTFTGAQYLYGPVYEWLSYDVASLRLFRLCTVVVSHGVLAYAATTWMSANRTDRSPGWLSRTGSFVVVLAGGGVLYSWLPLSPGYNDVSLLGALVLAAFVLHIATAGLRHRRANWWWGLLVGPAVTAQLLAKWTSAAVMIVFVAIAVILIVRDLRPTGVARLSLVAAGAAFASTLAVHLLVMPLPDIVGPMQEVTVLLGRRTNDPASLITSYLASAMTLVALAIPGIVIGVGLHLVARGLPAQLRVAGIISGPVVALGATGALLGGLHGGRLHITAYAAALLLTTGLVLVAPMLARTEAKDAARQPGRTARTVVLCLLATLPGMQALGTGNDIYAVAINGFGLWCVLLVATLDRLPPNSPELLMAGAATGLAIGLAGWLAADASVNHAYRTDTFPSRSKVLTTGSTGGLTIDRQTAVELSALRAALDPHMREEGTPVMAFDEMAGLVLALDGRSVGEGWYSRTDPERTSAGITDSCRSQPAPWPHGLPVLVFNRSVSEIEREAIAACGLSFPDDFTLLRVPAGPADLKVYVPLDE